MAGALTVIFWAITYVLILYYGFKYWEERPVLMPYASCCLNFGWEINALVWSHGFWGFIVWALLDIAIIAINIHSIRRVKHKVIYVALIIASILVFWAIFRLPGIDGMFFSVYAIDLIMDIEYLAVFKSISSRGKASIALTKLAGDFFALLCNYDYMLFISITGLLVLVVNLAYVILVIKNTKMHLK